MKGIFVFAFVSLYLSRSVKSAFDFTDIRTSVFGVFNHKTLHRVTHTVKTAFKAFGEKYKEILASDIFHQKKAEATTTNYRISKTRSAFSDFVDEVAGENDTESPEYLTLKSDPTALMSTPQLATLHGKRIESHIVLTKDGYFLTLHRLISSCKPDGDKTNCINEPILLHHGLLGSSADWILPGAEDSLPYMLSNLGYDVWMTNARGNYYSRGHKFKKVDSTEFWTFSWHEIGYYDLPAVLDYMKNDKNINTKINFIGYSMGATAFLVLLSSMPHYSNSFKMAIFLAPLAYMSDAEGPLRTIHTMALNPPAHLLEIFGSGEFFPKRKVPRWFASKHCSGSELFCCNPLFLFTKSIPSDVESIDRSFLARLMYHIPAGGSTNTIFHYAQLIKSGKFHKYAYDTEEYKLSDVTVPTALISSADDFIATVSDVLKLYFSIKNPIDNYVIHDKNFTHTDFLWGQNAIEIVFNKVVDFLNTGLNYNTSRINEL